MDVALVTATSSGIGQWVDYGLPMDRASSAAFTRNRLGIPIAEQSKP